MTKETRHWNALTIGAELESVGKIRIKAEADFPVHVHHGAALQSSMIPV
ncbi:hypothetical protein [Geomonas paludis]|nr:hypothetical protein [Geomonas paludis]